jgi:ABC-type Fe3+/spermidine/putrescine transport system ATPase subunit
MTQSEHTSLKVDHLVKFYEGKPLIKDLSFSLHEKEILCLLGPSGSGKSTLLRIIAGLEPFENGRVTWHGHNLVSVPPEHRSFGFMFQDYALFPHLTVFENVAFGLRMQHLPEKEITQRVAAELERVSMRGFADRKIQNLSGGEQQRIALARTLAPEPKLIMLDEPLGALDRKLREQLTVEIRRILKSAGVPAIYVTHDQEEAFTLADRILLLSGGQLAQVGTPEELYQTPNSSWVANFLGLGTVTQAVVVSNKPLVVHSVLGDIHYRNVKYQYTPGSRINLLVRPDGVNFVKENNQTIYGLVKDCVFQGHYYRTEVVIADETLVFEFQDNYPPGTRINITPKEDHIVLLETCGK